MKIESNMGIELNMRFVYSVSPWVDRGHAFHGGLGAGVFAFNHNHGSMNSWAGFRELTIL